VRLYVGVMRGTGQGGQADPGLVADAQRVRRPLRLPRSSLRRQSGAFETTVRCCRGSPER